MHDLDKIVSLAKRRGFIFPGSEIYGGLAGTWDYGPLGTALKKNIKNLWWKMFVEEWDDVYGLDAAILMNSKAWEASGHVSGFSDPMVECKKCNHRFRVDQLDGLNCPDCGGNLGDSRQFNMMFKTHAGAVEDETSVTYLRPETAGGIFVNFKNIGDTFHPKLPFGIAQIGKAFRNEIAPRDFIFRSREFEQMELEYFVRPQDWEKYFSFWWDEVLKFIDAVGIQRDAVHELEVPEADRAHYSKRTIDFEFDYPFGRKELYGLAYRTDFDLSAHAKHSGEDFSYPDPMTGEKIVPHVIEPSLGVDRTVLAVLLSAYSEDEIGGEKRTFLKLKPIIAPIKVAVFPLVANKDNILARAREVYAFLRGKLPSAWDDIGNIGKRYRRQDEIGTPWCVTIDYKTLEDGTVTVRERDTGAQVRIHEKELERYFLALLK